MIVSTESASRLLKTKPLTMEPTLMASQKVGARIPGLTVSLMRGNGITDSSTAREPGKATKERDTTRVIGRKENLMDTASITGLTETSTRGNF